ncbi:hypothetical protein CWO90_42020 [Bradyrhizobium sp. Leo121]|nr:hypothetical protein CWO90_42020 [Bradyrhizobium sp. Leo121]
MPGLARLRYRFAGLTLECPAKPRRSRVPGINVLSSCRPKGVDGRDKPGHDELGGVSLPRSPAIFLVISALWS